MKLIVDPDHSVGTFSVKHMMVTEVRGIIPRVNGTIDLDPVEPSRSTVDLTLDLRNLTTGTRKRDDHLMSEDFFHAGKYPTIRFRSKEVEPLDEGRVRVTGDLTMRGITRSVGAEVAISGPAASMDGDRSLGFALKTRLNREDFGINWNVPLMGGGWMVGQEVEIMLDVEADLPAESEAEAEHGGM
jgi:polyisoprenoid-binding protein YceI